MCCRSLMLFAFTDTWLYVTKRNRIIVVTNVLKCSPMQHVWVSTNSGGMVLSTQIWRYWALLYTDSGDALIVRNTVLHVILTHQVSVLCWLHFYRQSRLSTKQLDSYGGRTLIVRLISDVHVVVFLWCSTLIVPIVTTRPSLPEISSNIRESTPTSGIYAVTIVAECSRRWRKQNYVGANTKMCLYVEKYVYKRRQPAP